MEGNFIVLLRKIVEWEWYTDIPTKTLFLHLLLTANYKPKQWQGQTIKRGELITSVSSLSEQTGLTVKQIRRALDNLEKTNEIETIRTNKYTLVKVHNYGKYQDYEKAAGQTKGNQKANKGQQHNKETKKQNNIINNIITSERARAREPFLKSCPNVLLTEEQVNALLDRLSLDEFHNYCENVQAYIESGHKVHNCYQTIIEWSERDRAI